MNRRTTIRDVAREAGVSLTTVSHALNGYDDVSQKTRERIMEVASRLQYVPNENGRALGGKPQKVLAFMISGELYRSDPSGMVYGLISGLYATAYKNGYNFEIMTSPEERQNKDTFLQMCRKKGASGIAVYGLTTTSAYYQQIRDSEIPCVTVDVNIPGEKVYSVSVNNQEASFEMVNHLFEQGYQRIGYIAGKREAEVTGQRYQGYMRALRSRGITVRPEWIAYTNFSEQEAFEAAKQMKTRYPGIDAFFCISDEVAMGAIRAMTALGKTVPGDVGVSGFDDIPVSQYVYNGITTIHQEPYEIGRLCGESLMRAIDGKDVPHWTEAPHRLIVRGSTQKRK